MYEARIRIVEGIYIDRDSGCWIWKGTPRENGYNRTSYKGKSWYVHRLAFAAFVDENIPSELDICHICDNRRCCNPSHLFAGTRKENMADAVAKNRHATRDSLPQTRIRTSEIPGVLKRVASGELYKSIAKDYGVSRQTIGNIAIKNGVRRRQYGQ